MLNIKPINVLGVEIRLGKLGNGSRNVVSWSLYIINFIYFVGLAAGGLIVASSVELFGVKKLSPLLKVILVHF
jgi:molybdopterin-containing oxidoreductase family membrane subunit